MRLYNKSYTRTNLQTVLTQWPENKRPSIGFFNGALPPLAGNYLFNGILCELCADNGNIKQKSAPSKLQLKAVDIQGESEDLFEVR